MNFKSIVIFATILSILFAIFLPPSFISSASSDTILTISTFLFGILAGFYLVITTTDYNNVKILAGEETSAWISLYNKVSSYDKNLSEDLRTLIDRYIQRSFDHDFIEYSKNTVAEFLTIQKFISNLPSDKKSEKDIMTYEKISDISDRLVTARQQLMVLGAKTLSLFEWIVLYIVGIIVVVTLYGIRGDSLFMNIVTILVTSSIFLILMLLREIDGYIWNEKTFAFDAFNNVLTNIGLLPYYPKELLHNARPTEKMYRIGVRISKDKNNFSREITINEH